MSRTRDGVYYIEDVIRFRDRPDGVIAKMKAAGLADGADVIITVPQDPGSAGKSASQQQIKILAEQGNTARAKPTHANKVTRFAPFSAMAEAGMVKVVEGSWNNAYFSELEAFTGDGKTKDDQCDATSDAFITLAEDRFIPVFEMTHFGQSNPFRRD